MPIPSQCKALNDEIEALKLERAALQTELRSAPTNRKRELAAEIRRLGDLIIAKRPVLDDCIDQYGGPLPPQPINSVLTGTALLTTDKNFSGEPFSSSVTWGLQLDGARTQVFVTNFQISPIDTTTLANEVAGPFAFFFPGHNLTTISRTGGGTGSYAKAAGTLILPLTLLIDHSRDFPGIPVDSTLSLVLSTANPLGSSVTAAGLVTLAGSGVFSGGVLSGVTCTIEVMGTLSPVP